MGPLESEDPPAIGPFALVGRLGEGGMGRVYLGRTAAGRLVAVKTIRPEYAADREFRERFRAEAEAARRVGGFHTAPVVGADADAAQPWLATAFVPGPTLQDAVAQTGPLPEPSLRALGAGLAEALVAIHGTGLVHRDLKPGNILLTDDGPRVIDFGISRALEGTSLTGTGAVLGSPGYLAPEQALGHRVGPPADIFAFGAVLAFASGAAVFGRGTPPAMLFRVVHEEPDLTQLPLSLLPLVRTCLAKDPDQRPNAQQLLEALTAAVPAGADWLSEATRLLIAQRVHESRTVLATAASAPRPGFAAPPAAAQVPHPREPGAASALDVPMPTSARLRSMLIDAETGVPRRIVARRLLLDRSGDALVLDRTGNPGRVLAAVVLSYLVAVAVSVPARPLMGTSFIAPTLLCSLLTFVAFLQRGLRLRGFPPKGMRVDADGIYLRCQQGWILYRWPLIQEIQVVPVGKRRHLALVPHPGTRLDPPLLKGPVLPPGTRSICPLDLAGYDATQLRVALLHFAPAGMVDPSL